MKPNSSFYAVIVLPFTYTTFLLYADAIN